MRKSKYDNIIGNRYGNTTVVKRVKADLLECLCDCGQTHIATGSALVGGLTKRCAGCRKPNLSHGMSNTRIYHIWQNMKSRCHNPSDTTYKDYGARGISVQKSWRESFLNFKKDMEKGYADNLVLDRIDTYGNYEKQNCRWVTPAENTRNARSNVNVTIKGETKCLADWAKVYGIKSNTIVSRITKYGWEPIRAITTPVRNEKHRT